MHPALLVGAGFLLGTVGVKAIKSKQARKLCVKGIACGMKARDNITTMVDEARMELDDIMAEASYENAKKNCECDELSLVEEEITLENTQSDDVEDAVADTKSTATSTRASVKTSRKSQAKS